MQKSEENINEVVLNEIPSDKDLCFDNVSFRYDKTSIGEWTVNGVNLTIPSGKMTAIVGSSGSGKTTLLKLHLQYYPIDKGNIRLGGNDIGMYSLRQWRRSCGVVTFNSVWSENQFVKSGTQIFAVVPSNTSSFTGKIQVPLHGSGKIKKGQDVLITCDAFPYLEYGYIEGKVESISMIPDNNFYTVDVRFPQQLRFTSGEMVDLSYLT